MKTQPIVFAYWHNNEFKGFRADTFNTISKEWPKIYDYSKTQVETVINNVRNGCNRAGEAFLKKLEEMSPVAISAHTGEKAPMSAFIKQTNETEQQFRDWKEFEVRVIPFPKAEEWYELQGEGEEWKRNQFIENLSPAIEVHKFRVIDHEN